MIRKFLPIQVILLVLAISAATYCSSGQAQSKDDLSGENVFFPFIRAYHSKPIVWVEDGLTRVFKNDPARVNSNITLYTAKNEFEPFQIIVKAPASRNLTNVNVTISDFAGSNGSSISSANMTLYREHYLYVTQGSNTRKTTTNSPLGPGWYPDALIPFKDPVTHQDLNGQLNAVPFDLASGKNQPIWVDVYTPANTPAGQYSATATITSDQGSSTVAVTLNVWNFSLPKTRSLKSFTKFVIPPRSRTNYIELLKHRFNPKWVSRDDERFLIDNYGLDMKNVFTSTGSSFGDCQAGPAPSVSDVITATSNHQPELFIFTTYADEVWECESLFPEYLAWAANLRLGGSHPMIVSYPVEGLMGPDLDNTAGDIWSILPKHYDQAITYTEQLINHPSTQVWSYNPLVQDGYSPKFTIDFLPINARIMQGFINQSLGFTGTSFWRVDYWTNDPWTNAEAYRVDAPGEGHMVYPGDDVGLPDQIVSGVRMKWFREGSEDYEYIQMLKDLGQEQFALDTTRTVGLDFHTWTQDKDVLYAARKILGDKIQDLNSSSSLEEANGDSGVDAEDNGSAIQPEIKDTIRFAVIGDYGNDSSAEERVATLVNGWNPDFVITTGDNNYQDGEAATIDANIGQYYSQFIGNYQGAYGPGSPSNRFWPSLGNHDWHTITCIESSCDGAYFDYFTLPNNERYYEANFGLVHLFAIDSDSDEPDGQDKESIQAEWLKNQLAASISCHDIVFFHHPPYSSGQHGSRSTMQWPFSAWGADAVLSGHDHLYERLDVGGTPYFVNGAGGAGLYDFENEGNLPPEATSILRYNQDHGAMLVTATNTGITYQFYNADNSLIDEFTKFKNCTDFDIHSFLPMILD